MEQRDYWRFTPLTIKKLFKKNRFEILYLSYNDFSFSSIYLFAVASKNPKKWHKFKKIQGNKTNKIEPIGTKVIKNYFIYYFISFFYKIFKKINKNV